MSYRLRTIALIAVLALLASCGEGDDLAGTIVDDSPEPTPAAESPEPDEPEEPEDEGDDPEDVEPAEPAPDPCDDPPEGEDHIIVTEPDSGDEVGSTFNVEGCSSTFEANVIWELLDEAGDVLADGYAMGGTMGESGDLEFEVTYTVDGPQDGLLRVYAEDARDGSELHVNEVELTLNP